MHVITVTTCCEQGVIITATQLVTGRAAVTITPCANTPDSLIELAHEMGAPRLRLPYLGPPLDRDCNERLATQGIPLRLLDPPVAAPRSLHGARPT